ncbi:MAG: glycosyltransferase family 4 protein [Candidatus Bathyarchaeia archaeon]|jgi:glycosyltransferase involved in cell wall biosynthesis
MKIGLFVLGAQYRPKFFDVVSGHVQVALKTAEILQRNGHEVTIITNEAPSNCNVPPIISLDKIKVNKVANIQNNSLKFTVPIHFLSLRKLICQSHFDSLHFFGANSTAYLLSSIKASNVKIKSLMTFTNYNQPRNRIQRLVERNLFSRIDQNIALTEYTQRNMMKDGFKVEITFPGVLKKYDFDPFKNIFRKEKDAVLFWRSATLENGLDVCIEVFKRLSDEYESTEFIFAIRSTNKFGKELVNVTTNHKNIKLYLHPYKERSFSDLMSSASCVLLPFRELSINPQFAVLETLLSGIPLVTTDVESNKELVSDQSLINFVKPSDIQQTYHAVKSLLESKTEAQKRAEKAKLQVARKWNWSSYEHRLVDIYERLF